MSFQLPLRLYICPSFHKFVCPNVLQAVRQSVGPLKNEKRKHKFLGCKLNEGLILFSEDISFYEYIIHKSFDRWFIGQATKDIHIFCI